MTEDRLHKWEQWKWPLSLLLVGLILASVWRFTPLEEYNNLQAIQQLINEAKELWWTPILLPILYVIASTIMFPNMVMNGATILTLGGIYGWTLGVGSSLIAASLFFFIGAKFGSSKADEIKSERFQKIRRFLKKGGVSHVVAVRLVPIAPFPIVNLSAGALRIRFSHFLLGTFIALLPGTLTMALFGEQLREAIKNPTPQNVALLVAIVIGGALVILISRRKFHQSQT